MAWGMTVTAHDIPYGWALSRQYMADAGVAVAATQLPDPMDATIEE